MQKNFSLIFILGGLLALLAGAFIGVLISLVYISPEFLKEYIPFNQLRPLHTTSVVSWIILTAIGGLYFYIARGEKLKLYSPKLAIVHLFLYFFVGIAILLSLFSNNLGGREYMAFYPLLILPILLGWVLFGINYFKTLVGKVKDWPLYYWMWGVGITFMIFHLSEANFWIFDYFRSDYIKDMTVQWKSYGAFVGSWNMLVYGTALYIMTKIKDDINIARGRTTFFFFFLGLTNLMFGWAHHTYILPTLPWVRYVAYAVSMTEWIIFIKIVYSWRKSLTKSDKKNHSMAYLYIMASDMWVFLNLVMALFMSIPALNYFTHGTHITVAHSMGTTIGINTCILLASVSFIISKINKEKAVRKSTKFAFYLLNTSLFVFWSALIGSGIFKALWEMNPENVSISALHEQSYGFYIAFIVAGVFLFMSLTIITIQMIKQLLPHCFYTILPEVIQKEIDHIERKQNEE